MNAQRLSDDALAKLAYETYCKAVGGKAFNGDPLPDWETMKKDEKKQLQVQGWIKAARAVGDRVIKTIPEVAKVVVKKLSEGAVAGVPPRVRTLPEGQRTTCCGAISLTLAGSEYRCPCGKTTQAA